MLKYQCYIVILNVTPTVIMGWGIAEGVEEPFSSTADQCHSYYD